MPNYMTKFHSDCEPIIASATGQLLWELDFEDKSIAPAPGKDFKSGDYLCTIQASYAMMIQTVDHDCRLVDTCVKQGSMVKKGDTIGWVKSNE